MVGVEAVELVLGKSGRRGKGFPMQAGSQPACRTSATVGQLQEAVHLLKEQVPAAKGQHGGDKGGSLRVRNDMSCLGRKIAVLGKMAELGSTSKDRHIEIGKTVEASGVDVVVGICPEMKDMLAQVSDTKEKHYFENKDGLDDFLLNKCLQNNDIVLIKGARYSSKLYQVVDELLKEGS